MNGNMQAIIDMTMEEERLLLGSILRRTEDLPECMEYVKSEEFFLDRRHQNIWRSVYDFESSSKMIDPQRFVGWMESEDRWGGCGGKAYVLELIQSMPHSEGSQYYAKCVAARSRWRIAYGSVESFQTQLLRAINDPTIEVPEAIDKFEQNVYAQLADDHVSIAKPIGAEVQEAIKRARRLAKNPEENKRLKTGIPELDTMVYDFEPGSLVVIGADTSAGKTSLAMQIAENLAMNSHPVAYFSVEMTKEKLADRFLMSRSNLPRSKFNHPGNMSDYEWSELDDVFAMSKDWPLYLTHASPLDIYTLSSFSRRLKTQAGIEAIFVDYLQIMEYPDDRSEINSIRILSRSLKQLATSMGVAVVCLSQLRKRMAGQHVAPPGLDDLHSSSSLSKDADLVFMIHREEMYHLGDPEWAEENPDKVGKASVFVRKQRNGPRGKAILDWNGERTRFESVQDQSWTA